MWISLTENLWKDVQMERQEERRVLLMSMASCISQNPSPNQVSKEKQIAVKEKRVEECKASPQQRECTKGVWGKDLFLGIWTVSFQAINKGTLQGHKEETGMSQQENENPEKKNGRGSKERKIRRKGYRERTKTE